MRRFLIKCSLLPIAAAAMLMSGCASEDEIHHAQATADQALSLAQQNQQSIEQVRTQITTIEQRPAEPPPPANRGERG